MGVSIVAFPPFRLGEILARKLFLRAEPQLEEAMLQEIESLLSAIALANESQYSVCLWKGSFPLGVVDGQAIHW
jgi:hypothetical protein